jgi:hypothetical protein
MTKKPDVEIKIERAPESQWKALGGDDRHQWNKRLLELVTKALPINQEKTEAISHVGFAVMAGVVDMKPTTSCSAYSRLPRSGNRRSRPQFQDLWAAEPGDTDILPRHAVTIATLCGHADPCF